MAVTEADGPESAVLAEAFRRRRISLRTMDRPLRLATAGAFASLLAGAILVALRDVPQHEVYLGAGHGVHQIGSVCFVVALILLSIGLGYLVTAAETARPVVGVPAFLLLLFAIGFYTGAFGATSGSVGLTGVLPGWAQWTSRVLLALLVLVALRLGVAQRGRPARHELPSAHAMALLANMALFGGYWLTLAIASPSVGQLSVFGPVVNGLLESIALALYPFLQVAAVDFGEWGQIAVERINVAVARTDRWQRVVAVVCCLGLLGYGFSRTTRAAMFSSERLLSAGRGVVVVAVAWSVICVLGRLLRLRGAPWPGTLGFAAIAATCALITIVIVPIAGIINGNFRVRPPELVTSDGRFSPGADVVTVITVGNVSPFSLLLPRPWTADVKNGVAAVAPVEPGRHESLLADNFAGEISVPDAARQLSLTVTSTRSIGPWSVATARDSDGETGLLWLRTRAETQGGASAQVTYVIRELQAGYDAKEATLLFEAIGNSFHTADQGVAVPPPPDVEAPLVHEERLFVWEDGLAAAFAAVLVVVALMWAGRRHHRVYGAVLLFAAVVLMDIEVNLAPLTHFMFGSDFDLPTIGQGPVYVGIAVLGLGGLAVVSHRRWRRRDGQPSRLPSGLTALVGAITALTLMYWLYTRALQATVISVWAAIILIVAVTWEVVMSGESLTNFGTPRLPRATRLLAFLGYTILLSGTVLFFSAQTIVGGDRFSESFFEPEGVTQAALMRIGLPLFGVLLYLRLVARYPRAGETEAADLKTRRSKIGGSP